MVSMMLHPNKESSDGVSFRTCSVLLFHLVFLPSVGGAVSTPIIKVNSDNPNSVVLQCESEGWYPEPEVFWLDGEGNLLPAGPTETVRGPDDLYTVRSRVTVEKRQSNSFTCRVQQKNINQTRQTHIYFPADSFIIESCSAFWCYVALAVVIELVLVCIILQWIKWNRETVELSSPFQTLATLQAVSGHKVVPVM
ncbi:butyrophilin subfamily 2 member A2-like isoform X1 [Micropterus dolomieu]|uniref:butyrophilin subfamily 2 member A2-like isoform X1 n=1 Tax=Micropterus dolomieu TaxID=147949 RepID=UPI001E8DD051|nr:butyrophilin subfamily 2 member A2-like isoform X1 [Micropterus dolomieu]